MKNIFTVLILLISMEAAAQNNGAKPKPEMVLFNGQFLISTDFSSVYLNFIGAGFKYTKGHTTVSLIVFPALRFHLDNNPDLTEAKRPFMTAGFALGPLVQYKRFLIGFPVFYVVHDVKWRYSAGVSLRIGY